MDADWFHAGECDDSIHYGICAEHVNDVISAVVKWVLPRAGPNVDAEEHWQKNLKFLNFWMDDWEITDVARSAVFLTLQRWQWITSWIKMQKSMRKESMDTS